MTGSLGLWVGGRAGASSAGGGRAEPSGSDTELPRRPSRARTLRPECKSTSRDPGAPRARRGVARRGVAGAGGAGPTPRKQDVTQCLNLRLPAGISPKELPPQSQKNGKNKEALHHRVRKLRGRDCLVSPSFTLEGPPPPTPPQGAPPLASAVHPEPGSRVPGHVGPASPAHTRPPSLDSKSLSIGVPSAHQVLLWLLRHSNSAGLRAGSRPGEEGDTLFLNFPGPLVRAPWCRPALPPGLLTS